MTLQEASKRFDIPIEILQQYEENGLLQNADPDDKSDGYEEDDFRQLGLARFLLNAGFTLKETKKYLKLMKDKGTKEEQIRMLRKQRFELLDGIHEKQQILDQLDFLIWEKRSNRGEVSG